MKKLLALCLIVIAVFAQELQGISLNEYIQHNGRPEIEDGILFLSDNSLTDLTGLQDIFTTNQARQVRILYLSNNQLQTFPDNAFNNFINLEKLYLDNNQLQKLPKNIFDKLHNVQALYLDNNRLRKLDPALFSDLKNLETLYLQNNQLTELHENTFRGLQNLVRLRLNNNQLQTLPTTLFRGLGNLQSLDLRGNNFPLDFIPTLTEILLSIPQLKKLNGEPKNQALSRAPFSTLKQKTAERIAKNLNAYRPRLHELPVDLLDLLPLTQKERTEIEQKQAAQYA